MGDVYEVFINQNSFMRHFLWEEGDINNFANIFLIKLHQMNLVLNQIIRIGQIEKKRKKKREKKRLKNQTGVFSFFVFF